MYLELEHGRTDPREDMDDKGFDGPIIPKVIQVKGVYGNHMSLVLENDELHKKVVHIPIVDGMCVWDEEGIGEHFYGEWRVMGDDTPLADEQKQRIVANHEIDHATYETPGLPSHLADLAHELAKGEPAVGTLEPGDFRDTVEELYTTLYAIDYVLAEVSGRQTDDLVRAIMNEWGGVDSERQWMTHANASRYMKMGKSRLLTLDPLRRHISDDPPPGEEGGEAMDEQKNERALKAKYQQKRGYAKRIARNYLLKNHGITDPDCSSEVDAMIDAVIEGAAAFIELQQAKKDA